MKKSTFEQIGAQIKNILDPMEKFDFDDPLSNNENNFRSLLENLDDLIQYHNSDLLSDFCDQHGDQQLRPHNEEKLNNWLKDENILFLFEHDLGVKSAAQYYQGRGSFLHYYIDGLECYLGDDLNFQDLTEAQRSDLESDFNIFIPEDSNQVFYYTGLGYELTIPKNAILREYKNYIKNQK